jgi:beta-1,4-mannosyl-glycoprotein beta-1,4-N-acetylglucosaminyltransferase
MFYDEYEFELLEMRMAILDEKVDRFLIVQANRTFSGTPKPYIIFEDPRFARFKDKIIMANIDATNWKEGKEGTEPFEFWLRNRTMNALEQCGIKDSDMVLLGDLDEIPSHAQLEDISWVPSNLAVPLLMKYYNYYLNCQVYFNGVPFMWTRTRLFRYGLCDYIEKKYLENPFPIPPEENYGSIGSFCRIRHTLMPYESNSQDCAPLSMTKDLYEKSGWHFSNLGGAERIQQKFLTGANNNLDIESIRERIRTPKMLFDDGSNRKLVFVEMDGSFPKYILDNIDRLGHLIGSRTR